MRPLTVNEIEEVNGGAGFIVTAVAVGLVGYGWGLYQRYQDKAAAEAAARAAEEAAIEAARRREQLPPGSWSA